MRKSIVKATVSLTLIVFVAKIIGFLKSSVIASVFGANNATDEFYLASGFMSNVVYALMTAISLAFIPLYLKKKNELGEIESSRFATNTVGKLSVGAISLSILIIVSAPLLAKISAPTYSAEQLSNVTLYFRVLAIGILFSLTTRLLQSILDAEHIFGYGAICGIIFSVVEICFVLLTYRELGVLSLCISILVAYVIQNIFLRLRTRRIVRFSLNLNIHDHDFNLLLAAAVPVLLGNSVTEINQLIDRLLASSSIEGGVSALSYASVLYQFVANIISSSVVTVLFTELSESVSQHDEEKTKKLYNRGTTILCLILLPISIIACVNSFDVVKIAYGRGSFGESAISLTALVLSLYTLNFIPNSIKGVSTRVFYANGNTRTPMILSMIAVAINIGMSVCLTFFFGFVGIAIGTVIASFASMILQTVVLHKKYGSFGIKSSLSEFIKIFLSGSVCCIAVLLLDVVLKNESSWLRFFTSAGIGFAVYVAMLVVLRCKQLDEVKRIIVRKFK